MTAVDLILWGRDFDARQRYVDRLVREERWRAWRKELKERADIRRMLRVWNWWAVYEAWEDEDR